VAAEPKAVDEIVVRCARLPLALSIVAARAASHPAFRLDDLAADLAAVTRGGQVAGVIFHSDRGSEYTSADFARACARWKVRQSTGRVGSCFDNAVAEATFSTIKVEYVHRRPFRTRAEAG
jgi:transposase InsO family protein